jgi:ComF family protein
MGKAEALRLAVARTADALIAAALAPGCAACGRPLDSPSSGSVCAICWSAVSHAIHPQCPAEGAIDEGIAAGRYEGALRDIIHAFKYEGRRSLARPLGRLMRGAGAPLVRDADCVVAVPLHPWRRLRRGFNQALDLARELDRPIVHALWRVQATPPQMGLPARARRTNVRGAFILSPWAPSIEDLTIVLVEDVRTTGATLDACARVLKRAGAREVRALTVATADPPGRSEDRPLRPSTREASPPVYTEDVEGRPSGRPKR